VELTFDRPGINEREAGDDDDVLNIFEATERGFSLDVPKDMRDSALEYELKLYNGAKVRALIYLVYAEPLGRTAGGDADAGKSGVKKNSGEAAAGAKALRGRDGLVAGDGSGKLVDQQGFAWLPVTRGRCAKDCCGPILSAIQRFGKQGRTQPQKGAGKEEEEAPLPSSGHGHGQLGTKTAAGADPEPSEDSKWKDARNLFISLDEASNHVAAFGSNKCKSFRCALPPLRSAPPMRVLWHTFHNGHTPKVEDPPPSSCPHPDPCRRLLFGIFSEDGDDFLGSGVSGPIRVLANNDVPKGAACLRIRCALDGSRFPPLSSRLFPCSTPFPLDLEKNMLLCQSAPSLAPQWPRCRVQRPVPRLAWTPPRAPGSCSTFGDHGGYWRSPPLPAIYISSMTWPPLPHDLPLCSCLARFFLSSSVAETPLLPPLPPHVRSSR